MADKTIYCAGCFIRVAVIKEGSKIKTKSVMICDGCNTKRIASDLARHGKSEDPGMRDIFNDFFGRKL